MTHADLRLTDDYKWMRSSEFITFWEAEEALGRALTEAEELAIYDNKEDDNLARMGR